MINIAIDGYMGSGKSTLAKQLAEELDFKMLDTGAIFRAFAWGFGEQEMTEDAVEKFVNSADVLVKFADDGQHTYINGQDATPFLRTEKISQNASKISTYACVREKYLQIAKQFASDFDCVMEGRDIGSVVMPNASVKIFLTADEKVRAQRRLMDVLNKGGNAKLEDVLADLRERDNRDSTREIAPLKPCQDSVIVDNTDLNVQETVDYCLDIIKAKIEEINKVNVAIDGYVCSGKSTIARELARRLGFKVFDTGAVYRGFACAFKYMGLSEADICEDTIRKFEQNVEIKIEFIDGVQHVIVNGIDHTRNLRTEEISSLVPKISPYECIRDKVLKIQRSFALHNNTVMEGRDIGSHVLPNAQFKFFVTADESVRAQRRYEQQKNMGNDVSYDKILKELQLRDYADTHREHGAITKTADSIVVDTTHQDLNESVEFCLKKMGR